MQVSLTGVLEDGQGPPALWLPQNPRFGLQLPFGDSLTLLVTVFTRSGVPVPAVHSPTPVLSLAISRNPGTYPLITETATAYPLGGPNAWTLTLGAAQYRMLQPGQWVYDVWLTQGTARNAVIPTSPLKLLGSVSPAT